MVLLSMFTQSDYIVFNLKYRELALGLIIRAYNLFTLLSREAMRKSEAALATKDFVLFAEKSK